MTPTRTDKRKKNRLTAVVLFTVAGSMVGLAFAAVPLYRLFCQVTGFGGTPKIAAQPSAAPTERTITVRFDANVNPALPWRFEPEKTQVTVRAGESALAFYRARNTSDAPVTGTATFNVTPFKAGEYFSKIDCFCFTEQRLAAGEEAAMGVQFFVDPGIFADPNTRDVTAITLSYTFYPAAKGQGEKAKQVKAPAPAPVAGRPEKG
ncbi:MAG: cytochrome c oxidase assembly protein [Rhodospirillaceae bacterium]|jgi:cytochrome c oxidase assembly protein subunit 11|nr:cytochrome c oxidase assembly protein [Rhodospirillaceae bacterium]|tara:strand:+ start:1310 stop:1927 length:618 start_codon:yes stop_codon:yes gene_type:complete